MTALSKGWTLGCEVSVLEFCACSEAPEPHERLRL